MESTPAKKKRDWGKTVFLCVILSVPISNFLVFWLYVNFDSILMAFQYREGKEIVWGMENFTHLWKDMTSEYSTFWSAFRNTMLYFGANLLVTLPISLVLCYFFFKKITGYKAFRFIFYLPSILSASALVVIFRYMIAMNGILGTLYEAAGKEPISLLTSPDHANWVILFYTVMYSFGGNIILLGGAMNHIDASILEAVELDGCNMPTEMFQIVIPLIWPTLSTLIVFAFVGMLGSSGPLLLFVEQGAEGLNCNTLSYWIYTQVYYGGEYYYPSAIGLVMTAVGLPIALGIKKLLGNAMEAVEM